MDPERWKRIDQILERALSRPPESLELLLKEACAGDEQLRREVESIIRHDRQAGSFLESPALNNLARTLSLDQPRELQQDMAGRTLLHYHIQEKLGEGGMGVVYRAHDTHLNRSVAIKLLPPFEMDNPERRKRFIREARAASALNHPNIITIYDIGNVEGIDFIAMEYVAGKSLAQMIGDRWLPLRETLKLGTQLADALAKAHRAGIVHRDLKPSNIMVTDDGLVKVLDFGLAKLTPPVHRDDSSSGRLKRSALEKDPTAIESTVTSTQAGSIMGTAAYMSPEQAEGKPVDARSDIFTFGAVLYEMVTGRRAFKGDSSLSTLSAVLHQEPEPVSRIAAGIPQQLERIIARCLKKDPGRRFQHMDEVRISLEELIQTQLYWRKLFWIGLAATALVAGIGIRWFSWQQPQPQSEAIPLTSYPGRESSPSFSSDGNLVAFCWNGEKQDNWDIYVKGVVTQSLRRLTTNPAAEFCPVFSEDGRSIAFFREKGGQRATLLQVSTVDGQEQALVDVVLPEDRYIRPGPYLAWLPGGREMVIVDKSLPEEQSCLFLYSSDTQKKYKLTQPPTGADDDGPAVSPDGHWLAFSRGAEVSHLYLLEFSGDHTPKGEPRRITFENQHANSPAWTRDGREILFSAGLYQDHRLWRMRVSGGRVGKPVRLDYVGDDNWYPAISPRGHRLAFMRLVGGRSEIWRVPETTPANRAVEPAKLIFSTRDDEEPEYSPDGERIVFKSNRSGKWEIWVCNSDASNPVQLTSNVGSNTFLPRWSPDGRRILFTSNPDGNNDLFQVDSQGGAPQRLTADSSNEVAAEISRNGRWIYFHSDRTGKKQIWKIAADPERDGSAAVQLTRQGGISPEESPDGRFLYYLKEGNPRSLWRMPTQGGEEAQVLPSVLYDNFVVAEDGIYFLTSPGDGSCLLELLGLASGAFRVLSRITDPGWGLAVTPGPGHKPRSILYVHARPDDSDLMLVEDFR
jgi:serine/threonine protein kinase/Tol biopolymer transport system component